MNPNDIAPMVTFVTLIIVVGAVILLRPLAKRLGDLLEVMTAQRKDASANEVAEIRQLLSSMESRLALLEERQSFAEALLTATNSRAREGIATVSTPAKG